MKQHTVYIVLALIIGALALGVAYAAISNKTLVINGTASAIASDANFDVIFTDSSTGGKGTTIATIDAEANSKTATMTVSGLTTKGDKATATFTIKNNSSVDADVHAILNAGISGRKNETWFKVTEDLEANKDLAPGETTTMTVTVELLDTIVSEEQTETFTVTLTAKPE